MDVITDSYDKISMTQIQAKLSQRLTQMQSDSKENELEIKLSQKTNELQQAQQEEAQNKIKEQKEVSKDYFDTSSVPNNYDEKDFQRVLEKFKKADANIRSHEQIHASIGPTTSPISYNYQQGPDGKMYAVGGHVRLDTSIPDDPKAAAHKLDQIARAASGPSDPSGADLNIASQANLNKALLSMRGDSYEDQS